MIKIKVHDLKKFENFLTIAGKFVQQGQLIVTKTKTCMFCKNQADFSNCRLLLDTNILTIDESEELEQIKICIKDISAIRSSVSIVQCVENKNEITLEVQECISNTGEYFGKTIQYKGKTKFKLISVDYQIIEQFVSKDLEVKLTHSWEFNIDPAKLDIIQNRTGSIVNTKEDVSIYICPIEETGEVNIELSARASSYTNSFALPIATSYTGGLPEGFNDVAINESSFRMMNILKVTEAERLNCFFDDEYNVFCITSQLGNTEEDPYFINSRMLMNIVKGK